MEEQRTQWPKEKGQKDKQLSTQNYTENKGSSNTNHTKNLEWTRVFRNCKQFLSH